MRILIVEDDRLLAAGLAMMVSLLQPTTPFGWSHAVLVIVVGVTYFVLRMAEDNFIVPQVVGHAVDAGRAERPAVDVDDVAQELGEGLTPLPHRAGDRHDVHGVRICCRENGREGAWTAPGRTTSD